MLMWYSESHFIINLDMLTEACSALFILHSFVDLAFKHQSYNNLPCVNKWHMIHTLSVLSLNYLNTMKKTKCWNVPYIHLPYNICIILFSVNFCLQIPKEHRLNISLYFNKEMKYKMSHLEWLKWSKCLIFL